MSEFVNVEKRDAVVWIRLNRSHKKNALTQDMYRAMTAALQDAEADQSVAAVVLTGSGDSFTAGNDLNDFLAIEKLDDSAPPFAFLYTLSQLSVPVIAAVHGLSIGIGTTILLHCDLVYASSDAQFSLPFIHLGLVPEAASSLLLPQQIGHLRAAEMLLLGEAINASTALTYGLVNRVVAAGELEATVTDVAGALAKRPVAGLRAAKKLMKEPAEPVADRIAREAKVFAKALVSPEAKAAIAARMKKKS